MTGEDTIRHLAVKLAVLAEKMANHEESADDLQKDVRSLYKYVAELRAAVEGLKATKKGDEPVLLGKSASGIKDITQWLIFVLVILYSLGAQMPKEAIETLVKLLGKG